MEITKSKFLIKDGKDIYRYTIKNSNNMEVKILTLGGIITDIILPDKDGKRENVALKYKNDEDFFINEGYMGALIGRFCGRIPNGKVTINSKEYKLYQNDNTNTLHGGKDGLDKKIWNDKSYIEDNKGILELTYKSKDMEEGFPGNLDIKVIYSLDNDNNLSIIYEGISDEDTIFNMSNHVYLNLSGECKEKITSHKLYLNSYGVLEVDEVQAATGKVLSLENTPFDFTKEKLIGQDMIKENESVLTAGGYDHCFLLNNGENPKAILHHEKSGRGVEVYTDTPAIVVYTKNFLENREMAIGREDEQRDTICLETQNCPIGINGEFTDQSIIKANVKYKTETTFRFFVK